MELPTFDGKKTNRMLFFLFISVTCVILAVAALLSISREGHDVLMILILAVITGVTACFYGIYWVYSILKQKFMDKYFSEEEEDGESGEEDKRPACDTSEEFVLPAERLTSAALSASRRIAAAIWLADAALMLAGACAAVFGRASVTPAWLLYLIAYIALMSVPALILHLITRNALLGSVPLRIALSGNILKADDSEYKAADIEKISISVSKGRHPFRCLKIVTEDSRDRYRIDCAGPEVSAWDGFDRFSEVLRKWADSNGVELIVSS
ncbi:MAG: hypothetical protein IKD87_04805 [Oscillospiraceae bacterium]|nr:hypothetical protein [Oscillospiraceae bacterium]